MGAPQTKSKKKADGLATKPQAPVPLAAAVVTAPTDAAAAAGGPGVSCAAMPSSPAAGVVGGVFPSRHLDVEALYHATVTVANAAETLRQVELLVYDDRLLIASSLLEKLEAFLAARPKGDHLRAQLEGKMRAPPLRGELELLRQRAPEAREAAEDLSSEEGWTLAVRSLGFATYIRPVEGGQIYVKCVGEQEGTSVFDQLVVVREAGLYHRWGPFISSSATLHAFRHLDLIVHFEINAPLLHRDGLMRCYGCDYSEKDMVLICGDVAEPEDYPDLALPPAPNAWTYRRLYIRNFRCQVQIAGLNKGKVTVAALIDPCTALPQPVVNFAVKNLVAVLLYLIVRTARRVEEEKEQPGSVGAAVVAAIRNDAYYRTFCLPRILWYCEKKGWTWPGHPALPDEPTPLEEEGEPAVAAAVGAAAEGGAVGRGDSSSSQSTASSSSSLSLVISRAGQGEEEEEEEESLASPTAEAQPSPQKRKHFLRRLFRRRKHKAKHVHGYHHPHKQQQQQQDAGLGKPTSPSPASSAKGKAQQQQQQRAVTGASGGAAGSPRKPQAQQQQQQHQQQRKRSLSAGSATCAGISGSSSGSGQGRRRRSGSHEYEESSPSTQEQQRAHAPGSPAAGREGTLRRLLWTVPLLVLGYALVKCAVAPLVAAYAGPMGEAVVLAVLLQQCTAVLGRLGWLPGAAGAGIEVKLSFNASYVVLVLSLAMAAASLAGTALQTHDWAPPQPRDGVAFGAWARLAGARVHAINTGLFLLVIALVFFQCWGEMRKLR